MKNNQTKLVGGLECGAAAAKFVSLQLSGSKIIVDGVYLEEEAYDIRMGGKSRRSLEIVRDLCRRAKMGGRNVCLVAEDATATCFVLQPKMESASDADGARLLQARKLTSWDGSEPLVSSVTCDWTREREGSVVGLVDWEKVKPWCKTVETAGAVVDEVTVRVCGLEALAVRQKWSRDGRPVLIADIGAKGTSFYVMEGGSVRFFREVPVGGDAITEAFTAEVSTPHGTLHLGSREAEEAKREGVILPAAGKDLMPPVQHVSAKSGSVDPATRRAAVKDHLLMMARPVLERLATEVDRSIRYYRENAGRELCGVYLTGGSSRLAPLVQLITQNVAIPVQVVDPWIGMEFVNEEVRKQAEAAGSRMAVAVGLALADAPSMRFIPTNVRMIKKLSEFAGMAVLLVLALCFLPPLIFGTVQAIRARNVEGDAKSLRGQVAGLQAVRAQAESYRVQNQAEVQAVTRMQNAAGRRPLWAGVLNSLAESVPDEIVLTHVMVQPAPVGELRIQVEGHVLPAAKSFDAAIASLLAQLGASPFFTEVKTVNARSNKTEDRLGDFEVSCRLVY